MAKPGKYPHMAGTKLNSDDKAKRAALCQQRGLSTSALLRQLVREARGTAEPAQASEGETVPMR